eukprot:scaffold647908_cov46-Prasinocladus_malaysianus.AAC.2
MQCNEMKCKEMKWNGFGACIIQEQWDSSPAISYTVQKNLTNLASDCRQLMLAIDTSLAQDLNRQAQNRGALPDDFRNTLLDFLPDLSRARQGPFILGGFLRQGFVLAFGILLLTAFGLHIAARVRHPDVASL